MRIEVYDKVVDEARYIRETVFLQEQGFEKEYDEYDNVAKTIVMVMVLLISFAFLVGGSYNPFLYFQFVKISQFFTVSFVPSRQFPVSVRTASCAMFIKRHKM